jgi:hypothetical protein
MGNNSTFFMNCKHRIAAKNINTVYTLQTWFVFGV